MRIGFFIRLLGFGALLIALSLGIAAFVTYRNRSEYIEKSMAAELLAIVNTAAPMIDGDLVNVVRSDSKGGIVNEEAFNKIRSRLSSIKKSNSLKAKPGVSPLYIMRPATLEGGSNLLEFVVMTDPNAGGQFHVGNTYVSRPHNVAALSGRSASSGLYTDEEGVWISAAAPIFDRSNRVVAFVQADRPVGDYKSETRAAMLSLLPGALSTALAALLVSWGVARWMARPITEICRIARLFGIGQFGHRIAGGRNDELGDLAREFNQMADRIQTAQQALEAKNAELADALAAANAASLVKSEFLMIMSHELRTPMNGIVGFNEALFDTPLNSDQRESAQGVAASARELLELINNVLDYAHLDAQTVKSEQQEFDLVESMTVLRDKFRNEARNRGLALRLHLPREIPSWLHGDAKRVIQVLKHLIANAIKFTAKGEISLVVVPMKIEADRALIRFAVTDTGIGIPADARDRIFKPFSQADGSRSRRHGGLGLAWSFASASPSCSAARSGSPAKRGAGPPFGSRAGSDSQDQSLLRSGPPSPKSPGLADPRPSDSPRSHRKRA